MGGYSGLAGELAHMSNVGPDGRGIWLIECFRSWDLLLPGTAAIDVERVRQVLAGTTELDRRLRDHIAGAVAGAIESAVALLNPEGVLVAGPWGPRRTSPSGSRSG